MLKIIYFNCNSLILRVNEFYQYLIDEKVDVALLSETFLKSKHILKLTGYVILRRDANDNTRGGGVAILLREGIIFKELSLPSLRTLPHLLGVRVYDETGNDLVLVSTYIPNDIPVIDSRDVAVIFRLGNKVLFAGDMNSRHRMWKCASENMRGKSLEKFIRSRTDLTLHVPEAPTYFPYDTSRQPSYIDLSITKGLRVNGRPVSVPITDSDHNPVSILVSINGLAESYEHLPFQYSKASWPLFEAIIENDLPGTENVVNQVMLDSKIHSLTRLIHRATKAAIPRWKNKPDCLPVEIQTMIRNKNRLRREYQHAPTSIKPQIKWYLNRERKLINNAIKSYRNQQLRCRLSGFKQFDTKLYENVNQLLDEKKNIPPMEVNGQILYTDNQKANLIASAFSEVHKMNLELGLESHEAEVNAKVESFLNDPILPPNDDELTNIDEVTATLKSLKTKKAPGIDGLKNVILKHLPASAIVFLVFLINQMMKFALYPTSWKTASVTPVLKPGKSPTNPLSYRPISLLSLLSKLVERIIANRLRHELKAKRLIPDDQFGFKPGCATIHPHLLMKQDIAKGFDEGKSTAMTFLDIEKAFDCVWINGLIAKLIDCGISSYLVRLIHVYLTNRKFTVKVGVEKSQEYNIVAGVPQGSVLGPLLFIFYIFDIPRHPKTKLMTFADDTSVRCTDKDPEVATQFVQEHLNLLETYFNKWKIKVNAAKSEFILFTRRRTPNDHLHLQMNGNLLRRVTHVKYLGVYFQQNLKFNHHCSNILVKARALQKKLWKIVGPQSVVSSRNKIFVYKCYIRPVICYNIQVWSDVASSVFSKLQIFQNKFLRLAMRLRPDPVSHRQVRNVDVHQMANTPPLIVFKSTLDHKLETNIINHENELIRELTRQ